MDKAKILAQTTSYRDNLIQTLHDHPDEAQIYLQVAMEEYQEDGDVEAFLVALHTVAEAKGGMTELARKTRLNRQNLYKALSPKGNPRLETFGSILKELGFKLSIHSRQ